MRDLLKVYPICYSYGRFEAFFVSYPNTGNGVVELMRKENLIEMASKDKVIELNKKLTQKEWNQLRAEGKTEPLWYCLTDKGRDLAMSMQSLQFAEKADAYNALTHTTTIIVTILSMLAVFISLLSTLK